MENLSITFYSGRVTAQFSQHHKESMKKILLFLLIPTLAWATPPSRSFVYTTGEVISSSDVTTNENSIFNYLQSGVDTYSDGSIVNADISSAANIQSDKLNLTSVAQSISNTGTLTNTGNVTITGTISVNGIENAHVPAGVIMAWTTDTAPTGWLLCYGQEVSRTTYSDLFAVIGTVYGAGDASTTFNVPDLRGRFILGQDDMGGSSANRVTDTDADTLGNADGTETKTLTTTELPAHSHNIATKSVNSFGTTYIGNTENAQGNDATIATTSSGSGSAYSQMNPFMTLNFIIKG